MGDDGGDAGRLGLSVRRGNPGEGRLDRSSAFLREGAFPRRLPHADGRFHFRADWQAIGPDWRKLPPLPDQTALFEAASEEHPFRMLAPPARSFLNSSFTETPTSRKREGRPTARIHPDDLAQLGLADGARIRLGNRRGTVVLHARAGGGQQRGVIVVEGSGRTPPSRKATASTRWSAPIRARPRAAPSSMTAPSGCGRRNRLRD